MEFKKGCPACEHTDPQLELELEQLARLLVDDYLQKAGMLPIVFPTDPMPSPKKIPDKR